MPLVYHTSFIFATFFRKFHSFKGCGNVVFAKTPTDTVPESVTDTVPGSVPDTVPGSVLQQRMPYT